MAGFNCSALIDTFSKGRYHLQFLTHGTYISKMKKVDKFLRHDGSSLLLLSNHKETADLDLGTATDVVFTSSLSPGTQTQIIGRLTRCSRPSDLPVYVHKLQKR